MELQFQKKEFPYLATVLRKGQTQEQTQEVRISDGMPDIGNVLGAWGQVILRGKEWDSEAVRVSGGTMVWVQYLPEEGGQPQTVEAWIPFQMHWSIPATEHDGVILANATLKSVDSRSTSARKLMLRTNVSVLVQGMQTGKAQLFEPESVPEDVQLHTVSYPILLPVEAGEKTFTLEESFAATSAGNPVSRVIAAYLQPEITETRILGDKVVFRGNALLNILYETEDAAQFSADFDLPFSQYSELDRSYDEDAQPLFWPAVTSVETELEEGKLYVKAGLVCQYMIRHRPLLRIVEDAYSPSRSVGLQQQELSLPGILESKDHTLHPHCSVNGELQRCVNARMFPQPVMEQTQADAAVLQIPAQFQTLCCGVDGQLQTHTGKWEETVTIPLAQGSRLEATLWPAGRPQGNLMSGNLQLQGEMNLHTDTVMDTGLPMVTGLELGELQPSDPHRPSLILCRAGEQTLWQLAKIHGSTVEDIQRVNGLHTEPEPEQMLLIPVK